MPKPPLLYFGRGGFCFTLQRARSVARDKIIASTSPGIRDDASIVPYKSFAAPVVSFKVLSLKSKSAPVIFQAGVNFFALILVLFPVFNQKECVDKQRSDFGCHNGKPDAVHAQQMGQHENGGDLEHQGAQERNNGGYYAVV